MNVKNLLTICGVTAALMLSAGTIYAQNNGGGGGNGGGGNGGGGGGGRRGGGNFNPAQRQQFMMQRIQDQLGFTNETDWSAVQPLVQKVMDARRNLGGGMGMMFRGRGGRGGFGQQQSDPAADALQQAIDSNAPNAQIEDLLAKYQASQKTKQAALVAAQADLRKVLTPKQEAQATLMGLLD
jgi:Spy/CpxP family protein refolding chaperone